MISRSGFKAKSPPAEPAPIRNIRHRPLDSKEDEGQSPPVPGVLAASQAEVAAEAIAETVEQPDVGETSSQVELEAVSESTPTKASGMDADTDMSGQLELQGSESAAAVAADVPDQQAVGSDVPVLSKSMESAEAGYPHQEELAEKKVEPEPPTAQPDLATGQPADLEHLADELANGTGSTVAAVAQLRAAAARIQRLEATAQHFAQALQIVQVVVAQSGLPPLHGGTEDEAGETSRLLGRSTFAPQAQEQPRSFLVKRGDSDLSESSAPAAPVQLAASSGCTGKSGSAPLSRAEMDKQRLERLARLEQQQESARKRQEDAERRQAARDFTQAGGGRLGARP